MVNYCLKNARLKNEHEWEENGVTKTCNHDPLTDEEINKKLRLKSDDKSHYALKSFNFERFYERIATCKII